MHWSIVKGQMLISDTQLSQLLLEAKLLSEVELKEAQKEVKAEKIPLTQVLVDKDLIKDEQLGQLIADAAHYLFVNLSKIAIPDEVLRVVPEIVAKKQKIIAFERGKEGLKLAMADPENLAIREFIEKKTGERVIPVFATERNIANALSLYSKGIEEEFSQIIAKSVQEAKGTRGELVEPPIIQIVDTLLSYADQNKASDIHIEPMEEKSLVRFRIDGVLHDTVDLPREVHPQIITRIKVMARLRTDEHQAAQDGKLVFKTPEEKLDIRVSIVPITEGEKVVMRLLSEKARQFGLEDLGVESNDLKKAQDAFSKPYGMILSTGPTGCGKTTTQYSILKILNKRDVNIMTIEDPVEYDVEGVNQIQVNPKTELTFAKGLRSIVRQDPDIILVGEIRDSETAGIAINSAMTGHLVLSTLHTNDAATSLPRLLDMDVEPFLVASTVNLVIAQRLARKICTQCIESITLKREELEKHLSRDLIAKHFGGKKEIRVYHGKGCPICHQTGYVGRVGIFEAMEMAENIKKAVVDRADADTIRKLAVGNGMSLMIEDGLGKVKRGVTTIEEVLRVTKE